MEEIKEIVEETVSNEPQATPPKAPAKNGLAIAGFVIALVGICISFIPVLHFVAMALGGLGIIFGGIALATKRVNGFSLSAVIVGIVALIIALIMQVAVYGPQMEKARQNSYEKTDEANARSLRALISIEYMASDPDEWDPTQTYYLDEDAKHILTSSSGALEYVSKKYKDDGYISGTCDKDGIVTVNCEGVPPKSALSW